MRALYVSRFCASCGVVLRHGGPTMVPLRLACFLARLGSFPGLFLASHSFPTDHSWGTRACQACQGWVNSINLPVSCLVGPWGPDVLGEASGHGRHCRQTSPANCWCSSGATGLACGSMHLAVHHSRRLPCCHLRLLCAPLSIAYQHLAGLFRPARFQPRSCCTPAARTACFGGCAAVHSSNNTHCSMGLPAR